MKKWSLFFVLWSLFILPYWSFGQNKILFTGNLSKLCLEDDIHQITSSANLPDSISNYDAIFIFSGAESILKDENIEDLLKFLKSGKGLYLGSDNWPLQVESNQLTQLIFSKQTWGNFTEDKAMVAKGSGLLSEKDSVAAGTTTVAFPLDFRLRVVAWVADEPLIQAGELLGGKIILDGGYSRFYCSDFDTENKEILMDFIDYLIHD